MADFDEDQLARAEGDSLVTQGEDEEHRRQDVNVVEVDKLRVKTLTKEEAGTYLTTNIVHN